MSTRNYTVSEAAELAHVTVRTLHHYDEIGLLSPAERTPAGYRLYGESDLQRLHQILLFRELGFPLEAIRRLLDDPAADRRAALREQREVLERKVRSTRAVIRAIDTTLNALDGGQEMDTHTLFDGFDQFDHAQYAEEAKERWGETEAYKESMRRTRRYTKEDWAKINAEADAIYFRMAEVMSAGSAPEGSEATALAEEHRLHIDRWFYPCGHAMHRALAEMYVADPRFTEFFEQRAPGLAKFFAAAIRANAERAG